MVINYNAGGYEKGEGGSGFKTPSDAGGGVVRVCQKTQFFSIIFVN